MVIAFVLKSVLEILAIYIACFWLNEIIEQTDSCELRMNGFWYIVGEDELYWYTEEDCYAYITKWAATFVAILVCCAFLIDLWFFYILYKGYQEQLQLSRRRDLIRHAGGEHHSPNILAEHAPLNPGIQYQ